MINLMKLRHELHQYPELSGYETETAKRIVGILSQYAPSNIIENLGGTGVAAIFDSGAAGETVLIRCELDALPIFETGNPAHKSTVDGKAHLCGHDGHMTILISLAERLSHTPIKRGRAILLFQPAEENGAGARSVIDDAKFETIKPDISYALHNLPGRPLGEIGIKAGAFNFASCGLSIALTGRTSHASHPEDAISPTQTTAELLSQLPQLTRSLGLTTDQALITICHAQIGEAAFGITPGNAKIFATLRSVDDATQETLIKSAKALARKLADRDGLSIDFQISEAFAACDNDKNPSEAIENAANSLGLSLHHFDKPFRWSEDFGLFGSVSQSALFVLGAGENCPQLHAPDYDFPDQLIPIGADMFEALVRKHCG